MLAADPLRYLACLYMPGFFVALERRRAPALAAQPLLIGGTGDRGVVVACCAEAAQAGVQPGLPLRQARLLCPQARLLPGDPAAYQAAAHHIAARLRAQVPATEPAALDTFFLDLTDMERYLGAWAVARRLGAEVAAETGLPVALGLAGNKLLAQLAAQQAGPGGVREVTAADAEAFLGPLPLRALPSVGEATARALAQLGVRQVADLRQIPPAVLRHSFGPLGERLSHYARGHDPRLVQPATETPAFSASHAFAQDTTDLSLLRRTLIRLVEGLGFRLRAEGRLATRLRLDLRYSTRETAYRQCSLPFCAEDQPLIDAVHRLLDRLYTRRLRVRHLKVQAGDLTSGSGPQLDLFTPSPRQQQLYEALDAIRRKHGPDVIGRG